MIKLYHVPRTRGKRVIWLLEELELPYTVEMLNFNPEFKNSPEWLRKNPVGKVPAMEDGDFTMFESGAMVQYILDRYGKGRLQPEPGTEDHARYLQWSWFAESTFARPIGEIVNHRRAIPKESQSDIAIKEMQNRAHICMAALEQHLRTNTYLLGETFTAADIMMGYSLDICYELAPTDEYKVVNTYWQRLQTRPGYQIASKTK